MGVLKDLLYYRAVRPFVKEAAKSFLSNRERYTVYKNKEDYQGYLVFDNKHERFYPFWVNSSKKVCEAQHNKECYSGEWYLQIVRDLGYSASTIHWTGFLSIREQEYLYEKVYHPLYKKFTKETNTRMLLEIREFENKMLDVFKEEKINE